MAAAEHAGVLAAGPIGRCATAPGLVVFVLLQGCAADFHKSHQQLGPWLVRPPLRRDVECVPDVGVSVIWWRGLVVGMNQSVPPGSKVVHLKRQRHPVRPSGPRPSQFIPRGLPFYTKASVPWFLWWALPTPWTATGAGYAARRRLHRGGEVVKLFTGSYVKPDRIKAMKPKLPRRR